MKAIVRLLFVAFLGCFLFGVAAFSAPFDEKITFTQPDGTQIVLNGRGDEFYAVFESLDGYAVTFDPATKAYYYAQLSPNGEALVPVGLPVGQVDPATLGLAKHLRISQAAQQKQVQERFQKWDQGMEVTARWNQIKFAWQQAALGANSDIVMAPPSFTTTGTKVGLTLLIDFSDDPATIPQASIIDYCNGTNYTGYGNNGSVMKYFYDNSNGLLTYTNVVTIYIRMAQPKTYYNNTSIDCGTQGRLLINDAITIMKALPNYNTEILPTFSGITVDGSNRALAFNVFYAGGNGGVWSYGLWPHSWSLASAVALGNGKSVYKYQITNIGSSLSISTFCHENGHMLCGYPDIYDYGYDSIGGAGVFCLMGYGASGGNPVQICAYLKRASGWATTVAINSNSTLLASVSSSGAEFNKFYRYQKPGVTTEYYLVENRQKNGRDNNIPGGGVAIWHIDELGNRDNQSTNYNSSHANYEVALIQADNLWHFQNKVNSGDVYDLYYTGNAAAAYTNAFTDTTAPSARWWDGSNSNMKLSAFSAKATTMTFLVGTGIDLAVSQADAPDPVLVNDNLTYSLIVTNLGVSVAPSVVVTDTLPASVTFISATATQGTIASNGTGLVIGNLGTINANATASISILVRANTAGSITNWATVNSTAIDSNLGNNTAVATTTVVMPALLGVSPSSLDFGSVATGATVQASFVVTNSGGAVLNGSAILSTGNPFSIVTGGSYTLSGNAATNIVVSFTPANEITYTDNVVFTSNGGNSTNLVSGTGSSTMPGASFTGTPTNGAAPLTVTFTDTSSGAITNRTWIFGDGGTSNTTATSLTYTYRAAGSNTVQLTVSGPGGASNQTRSNYIVVAPPATAMWTNASASGNWSTAANWNPVAVPDFGTAVTFATGGTTSIVDSVSRTVASILFNRAANFVITASGGAGLTVNTGITVSSNFTATITAPLTLSAANTWFVTSAGTLQTGGTISGGSPLTKTGSGPLLLNGNNNYSGATIISNGTIKAGSSTALGSTATGTTVQSGGVLDVNGQNLGAESITITGDGAGSGAIINTGAQQTSALQQVALAGNASIGGVNRWDVRGSGATVNLNGFALTKTGANQISFVGATITSGNLIVNAGTLSLEVGAVVGGTGSITVNSGGYLNFWPAGNNVTRAIILNGGTISVNSGTPTTVGSPLTLSAPSFIATATTSLTLTGVISGVAGFTKLGTNTLILSGSSTYTGVTTISNGTLVVTGAIGTGTITVASGASLGGTGIIRGPVTINGTLTPGNAVGSLTISNDLTCASTAVLQYQLGASNDLAVVTGALTLGGTLNITDAGGFTTNTYTLFTYSGTLTGNAPAIGTVPNPGYTYAIDTNTVGQVKLLVAVPPQQQVTPTSYDYGTLLIGQSSNATFQVVNTGGGTLTGTAATASPFSVTGSSYNLGSGQTGLVTAAFSPAMAGTFNANVSFTGNGGTNSIPVTGVSVCPTISLSPSTLPNGTVGAAYSQTFTASGAAAPYSFSVTGGALPAGLSLFPAGLVSGTPTTEGVSAFTVTATDANNCAGSQTNTLTILAAPCTYALSSTNTTASVDGGTYFTNLYVSASSTGCTWTAHTADPWITDLWPTNATGSTMVSFSVLPNSGGARTGTIIAAGLVHTVEQARLENQADLLLTKLATPTPVPQGQNLTYTLTVNNLSSISASNVVVTDPLPASVSYVSATADQGTCTNIGGVVSCYFGTIPGTNSAVATIVVIPTLPGALTNLASVLADTADPNSTNNAATVVTPVTPAADVAITKTNVPAVVVARQSLFYTLTVTNRGPSDATSVTVTDSLPAGVTFQSATVSQGTYSNRGGLVVYNLGILTTGSTATAMIDVTTVNPSSMTGTVQNTAVVAAAEFDPDPANNLAASLATVYADSVGDSIPDWWRAQYFVGGGTNTNNFSCATCDYDGDGFSTGQEYLAGTVPTNSMSALRILTIALSGPDLWITFSTVSNKLYEVQRSRGLSWTSPSVVTNNVPGTGNPVTVSDPGAALSLSNFFYRVRLQP